MDTLEWRSSGKWCDTKGNALLSKRLSKRKVSPKALIDDIEKKYYTLVGHNYLDEGLYVESTWPISHHLN